MEDEQTVQLVTFFLGAEKYGVDIMDVQEIVQMQPIRPIPGSPRFIAGLLNLRGRVIPIVNLHERFSLSRPAVDEAIRQLSGMVILDVGRMQIGIIIDKVSRVSTIDRSEIHPPPREVTGIGSDYIDGVVNESDSYLIILNIRRMFSQAELAQLEEVGK